VANPNQDWIGPEKITLKDSNEFLISTYFIVHPKHILGELGTYTANSLYKDTPRTGLCVKGLLRTRSRKFQNS
jgi:hypothetical protein